MAEHEDGTPAFALGARFVAAVEEALRIHAAQARKGTGIPYAAHLLGVASMVLEQEGASEDEAIAALLHDAIEDQPELTSFAAIEERFGTAVRDIVEDCTDAPDHPKPPWRRRKREYLLHLEEAPEPSLRVSLADKLHNARAMVLDAAAGDPAFWSRFNAPPVAQRWYYTALAEVFQRRLPGSPHARELGATVERLVPPCPPTCGLRSRAPRCRRGSARTPSRGLRSTSTRP